MAGDPAAREPKGDDQLFLLLQQRLRQVAHLIVIDNVETIAEPGILLLRLERLCGPSKFILTSRNSLLAYSKVFPFALHELARDEAVTLIRQEARATNLPDVADAAENELAQVHATVGGNPLALRLVVGQLHIHPLSVVLGDLQAAHGLPVDNLYTFIYRRAWEHLDEGARAALLATALLSLDGDDLDYLANLSGLAVDPLRVAIDKLVKLNLVERRGTLQARRYAIHALTRTFLLEQVAKWM